MTQQYSSISVVPIQQESPNYDPVPNPACEDISSGRRHFANNDKIMYLPKFVDLLECNISRNNHIT